MEVWAGSRTQLPWSPPLPLSCLPLWSFFAATHRLQQSLLVIGRSKTGGPTLKRDGQSDRKTRPLPSLSLGTINVQRVRVWHPHISAILAKYPDDVRFVYRHWPLTIHERAYPAARAAECAGEQGRFWQFHTLLYEDRIWISRGDDEFVRMAEDVELPDLEHFRHCIQDHEPVRRIEADIVAVQELGGRGTPTVMVNGLIVARNGSIAMDKLVIGSLR